MEVSGLRFRVSVFGFQEILSKIYFRFIGEDVDIDFRMSRKHLCNLFWVDVPIEPPFSGKSECL